MHDHPLLDGLRIEPTPGPTSIVIFGASGDLTQRKLLPALYHLSRGQRLPARFTVIGVARTALGDDGFRKKFRDSIKEFAGVDAESDDVAASLTQRMFYMSGELDEPALYDRLAVRLRENGGDHGVLYYLAIPPSAYRSVVERLGAAGLTAAERGWRRIIVEKPFGTDLHSARALNHVLHAHFSEEQVFRIDHYLGKETVQNLMVFRFANGMFEPIWNRRYIDHVQITAAETVGVERRAAYYEGAGALRDMVQNHLMQLLTLVAMEPPIAFTAESVRDRKMDALLSVQPLVDGAHGPSPRIVRAQYAAGWVLGAEVPGYRSEPGVAPGSTTETYVAMRLHLDNWRWAGVPFYLRTGKRLPKRTTEIAIQFRRPPMQIFKRVSPTSVSPNLLIVNVQPDEGISVRFEAKLPGTRMQLAPVMMNFRYGTAFGGTVPEAYETLLLDAMLGEPTLFARHDFVEASWALITPVLERWRSAGPKPIPQYEAGEWGPAEVDVLMAEDGRRWRTL
ncbi:MAG: glucose-6-phosphate dehydrogenase [Acidobacteria bacterium]|nr:glucose-6-phosphate dehydrogenase [Acidobacteriota bacterium]MCA1649702.1 glucose-6-phosphate dehydrogenase [Acidobacteriota bacterium]